MSPYRSVSASSVAASSKEVPTPESGLLLLLLVPTPELGLLLVLLVLLLVLLLSCVSHELSAFNRSSFGWR